jgi:hypothetical protein
MKVKARLRDLDGRKYYGTYINVEIYDQKVETEAEIKIWVGGTIPSRRELENAEITKQQWLDNDSVDDDPDNLWPIHARDVLEMCDSHMETETDLLIAEKIVEALNSI